MKKAIDEWNVSPFITVDTEGVKFGVMWPVPTVAQADPLPEGDIPAEGVDLISDDAASIASFESFGAADYQI